jgi:uncharacterized membrane protein YphA (DoxX/SURF4 family)
MANAFDFFDRTARALPRMSYADFLLRLPLAGILLQYGINKFPLSPDAAMGFGVPYPLWILAAVGEVAAGIMLLAGGLLRGSLGDLVTRIAGAAAAIIVAGVIYVAYWAPPLDLLLLNQLHLMMLAIGLYFALAGKALAAQAEQRL